MKTEITISLINAHIIVNGKSKIGKVYLVRLYTEHKHHLICNLYYNKSPINQYKFSLYNKDYLIELHNWSAKLLSNVVEIPGQAIIANKQYCLTKSNFHGYKRIFNKS
jgi:hypothetical protein